MGSALAETVVVVAVGTVLLFWAMVATVTVVAVRRIRRRYRALRARLPWRDAPRDSFGVSGLGATTASTIGSSGWWLVQHDRRRMWKAVWQAEHAVGVAQRSGAPLGDLPTVARQLTKAARAVDALLRASAADPSSRREARTELARVETAAADLHRAALESLRMIAGDDTDDVVSAARVEVTALAAGLQALRRVSPSHRHAV
jgi:hypothetical protein